MNDLKFAFRQLLKNPGFTAVAVLTRGLDGACRLPARHARTQPIREYGDNSPPAARFADAGFAAGVPGFPAAVGGFVVDMAARPRHEHRDYRHRSYLHHG